MALQCRHFPACGGCQTLDLDYPAQLAAKAEELRRHFSDWADLQIAPIVPSPRIEGYRHKVQLPFAVEPGEGGSRVLIGCFAAGSHQVVDQSECLVQDPDLSDLAWTIRDWAQVHGLPIYRENTGEGWLRYLLLRKGAATGEVLLGLVTNGPGTCPPGQLRDLVARGQAAVGRRGTATLAGVVQNLNAERTNVVLGAGERLLWGRPFLREALGPFRFEVGMSTFFQVNPFQTPRLYDLAVEPLPTGAGVLDLYCGIGSIALWAARKAGRVLGIEENPASVEAARRAAVENGVGNAEFRAGDVSDLLAGLAASEGGAAGPFSAAIVDPPRKGLEERVRRALASLGLTRIVYVSCYPATLARDARALRGAFALRSLAAVDMFPHTRHVECVAVFDAA
jgi:23S rRNA (uracil1939-C5)-methyltransferase